MEKSSFISVLKTFTPPEVKRFDVYLRSPFFNTNKNLTKIYSIIKKYYPDFQSDKLTKEFIFKKIFPDEKFSDDRMRFLISELLKHALSFLQIQNLKDSVNEKSMEISFLRLLNDRHLDKLFLKHSKKLEKSLFTKNDFEPQVLRLLMELETEKAQFYIKNDKHQKASDNILKKGEYLICYLMVQSLRITDQLMISHEVFNARYKANLAEEFMTNLNSEKLLNYMEHHSLRFYVIVAIYYYSSLAQNSESDLNYKKFKELLEKNIHLFCHGEKYNLYRELESCCWVRIRHGNKLYLDELFILYKEILIKGLYKFDKLEHFRIDYFRNIIINGLNVKEFEWTEKFINDYSKELAPEHKENMLNYSLSLIYFERGSFEKSLEFLAKVKYEYFHLKVDVKNWLLKIYYELNLFDQANSLVDSYRHFLTKNKSLTDEFRKINAMFLNCYVKLLKIKSGDYSSSPAEIKHELSYELSKSSYITHKRWIMEKMEEFENSKS